MKLAMLVLLAALVLGGLVGVLMARDPGYVLVAYEHFAVETSLWFAVLVLLAAYLVVRLVVFLVRRLLRGGVDLRGWTRRRRSHAAQEQTARGLLLLAEGRWSEARKRLERAAPAVQAPLINYLCAARAAHEQGDSAGRDALLRSAHESTAGSRFAVGLTQARLQCDEGQWALCLATLLQLYRQAPRHPEVLRMLVSCYRHLEDWQALLELTGDLRKHRVLEHDALLALQIEAWQGRLAGGRDDPGELWKQVPRELRREPVLAAAFARALAAADRGGEAETLVRQTLEHRWDDDLVGLYGTIMTPDPGRQLAAAEGWLKEHPDDGNLLLALGRVSLMNGRWAKAREYLEASLRLQRSAAVQAELGRLCVALGDVERGGELLAQSQDGLPSLPLPERQTARGA